MIKTGIIGSIRYLRQRLIRILLQHNKTGRFGRLIFVPGFP